LIGLLFVAIFIQPERTFHPMSMGEEHYQRLAEATLLGLSNAFVVSSLALIPEISLDWINLVLGTFGVILAIQLGQRFSLLHRHGSRRRAPSRDSLRAISLSVVAAVLYAMQGLLGLRMMLWPDDESLIRLLALIIVGIYVLGIARAWTLLGDPRHGWSGWLNPLQDLETTSNPDNVGDGSTR
jgi:hypothetical protein